MARLKLPVLLGVCQLVFIVLFAIFVRYDKTADASDEVNSRDPAHGGADPDNNPISHYYPMFQDVHVMMFIGFGFLMTFLKKYGYGSVGYNMLIAAFVLQWATLVIGFFEMDSDNKKIHINVVMMLLADFASAAVLISFGAVLGKTSALQLIVMAIIEIVLFQLNTHIGVEIFKVADIGGSIFVHTFGAYFGLSVAKILYKKDIDESNDEGSSVNSDLFSMIGTVFLWLFWPSFNSALAPGDDQHRAVLNTYYSLASCVVVTFALSTLVDKNGKVNMVHIQNATLAGGVAVGTTADMMIQPWGAIVLGSVAAIISVLGFTYLTPFMASKLKLHDTCGVNNLHGMPGLLASLAGIIAAAMATKDLYKDSVYQIFAARAPVENSTELYEVQSHFSAIEAGDGRTAGEQAAYQLAAVAVTLVIAIVGGVCTGLLLKLPIWDEPKEEQLFNDERNWLLPDDDDAEPEVRVMKVTGNIVDSPKADTHI